MGIQIATMNRMNLLCFIYVNRVFRGFTVVSLFTALLCPATSYAEDYELFNSGIQNPSYNEIVEKLHPGDRISFSNGKWFSILDMKKHGNTTLILQISEVLAIRIPLKLGKFASQFSGDSIDFRSYINMFYRGNRNLVRLGVATVKVFDYLPGEYVVVNKLDIQFTFEDFIYGKIFLNQDQKMRLLDSFYNWVESTGTVTYIGDFNESQVGFDLKSQSWILFDNTDVVHSVGSFRRHNRIPRSMPVHENTFIGDHMLFYPRANSIFSKDEIQKVYDEISSRISTARKKPPICAKLFTG